MNVILYEYRQLHVKSLLGSAAGVNFVQDSFGKSEYLAQCELMGIIPSTQVVKFLQHDDLDLTHYGLGDKVWKCFQR